VEDVARWLLVFPYAALIYYLSSKTGHQLPRWWFMRYDKVLHALEYSGLAFLLTNALGCGAGGWRSQQRSRSASATSFTRRSCPAAKATTSAT
jgi:hypothetical protein